MNRIVFRPAELKITDNLYFGLLKAKRVDFVTFWIFTHVEHILLLLLFSHFFPTLLKLHELISEMSKNGMEQIQPIV